MESVNGSMPELNSTSLVVVAQLGARMHYAVSLMFYEAGLLQRFYTDYWHDNRNFVIKIILEWLSDRVKARNLDQIPASKVTDFLQLSIEYSRALSKAEDREDETATFLKYGRIFGKLCAKKLERESADIIYAFNTAALEIFQSAQKKNTIRVLEQTLVPRITEYEILNDEYQNYGLTYHHGDFEKLYIEREKEEWKLADLIICGSQFVKKSLITQGVTDEKIEVVPYGYDSGSRLDDKVKNRNLTPLRCLFAGNGGIRKGLLYAVEAIKISEVDATLTVAGSLESGLYDGYKSLNSVAFLGTVKRDKMHDLYNDHDIFILPSLCEGSATVIYEALSYGLPVICTENCGSVITDGVEGFIVPVKRSEEIADAITKLSDSDRYKEMSRNAFETASQYTVTRYKQRLLSTLQTRGLLKQF